MMRISQLSQRAMHRTLTNGLLFLAISAAIVLLHAPEGANAQPPLSASQEAARNTTQTDAPEPSYSRESFALRLYRQESLDHADRNLVLSPSSIRELVLMVYGGSRGETSQQIGALLGLREGQDPNTVGLVPRRESRDGPRVLLMNSVWYDRHLMLREEYLQVLGRRFSAYAGPADFRGDPEVARATANDWVKDRTQGRIATLFAPGSIDRNARVVLANALDLSAEWEHKFPVSRTVPRPFHLESGKSVEVPMMSQDGSFGYGANGWFQAVELPYRDCPLSMIVVLPRENRSLAEVEEQLTEAAYQDLTKLQPARDLLVSVPRFQARWSGSLKKSLQALGMREAFSEKADLRGMASEEDLALSDVCHSIVMEVSESGTQVVAASGAAAVVKSPPAATFIADRPFVFLLRDRTSQQILAMGHLVAP